MAENIHVKLPDGSVKDVPSGTTALDIAKGISPRLADAALAAQIEPTSSNGGNGHPSASSEKNEATGAAARRERSLSPVKTRAGSRDHCNGLG